MLDGVDGLATGVTAIAPWCCSFTCCAWGNIAFRCCPWRCWAFCLGFWCLTYPRQDIPGGGALVLGYAPGALSIVAGAKVATALLVLWVPIVDWLWQVYSRWKRGQPIPWATAAISNFACKIWAGSAPRIALLYYSVTAVLGAVALASSSRGSSWPYC